MRWAYTPPLESPPQEVPAVKGGPGPWGLKGRILSTRAASGSRRVETEEPPSAVSVLSWGLGARSDRPRGRVAGVTGRDVERPEDNRLDPQSLFHVAGAGESRAAEELRLRGQGLRRFGAAKRHGPGVPGGTRDGPDSSDIGHRRRQGGGGGALPARDPLWRAGGRTGATGTSPSVPWVGRTPRRPTRASLAGPWPLFPTSGPSARWSLDASSPFRS